MKQNRQTDGCKVIGLTGGVGTGKTTVAMLLRDKYQIPVLIADEYGHRVMEAGSDCYQKIISTFGRDICNEDGNIDRRRLGNIVFHNKELLQELNAIVHPSVQACIKEDIIWLEKEKGIHTVVMESAILFESGFDKMCTEVWYVQTSEEIRRKRLKEARDYSDEKIDAILKNQMSSEEIRKRADVVIQNDGAQDELEEQLEKMVYINI